MNYIAQTATKRHTETLPVSQLKVGMVTTTRFRVVATRASLMKNLVTVAYQSVDDTYKSFIEDYIFLDTVEIFD